MDMFKKDERRTVSSVLNEVIGRVNSDTRRLRLIEQENSVFQTRINRLEADNLRLKKDLLSKTNLIDGKLLKQGSKLTKIENMIKEIVKQMKLSATKTDVSALEELVEIYNPISSKFVTREEVERILQERTKKS
ncbi:MAG: hypothetical protein ABIJ92_04725 [Candidatus Aenigmatarchaeota archaeon]